MHRWYTRDWMDYAAVKDNYTPAAERNAAPASIAGQPTAHKSRLCTTPLKPPYSAS